LKPEKMMRLLNQIDDRYLEEAEKKRKAAFSSRRVAALAACFVLIVASMVLFTPYRTTPPTVEAYRDSEYYPLIEKINAYGFAQPKYKNNFEFLTASFASLFRASVKNESVNGDLAGSAAPGAEGEKTEQKYQEATDNQTLGVIEGDLVKRSDRYLYYLDRYVLRIFTLEGKESLPVGTFDFEEYFRNQEFRSYTSTESWEIFLSQDCRTLTAVIPYYEKIREKDGSDESRAVTHLVSLDVSDPGKYASGVFSPHLIRGKVTVSGEYLSARLIDGVFLLMTCDSVDLNPDFSDESSFLPQIDRGEGFESLSAKDLYSPETLSNRNYTVICKLDGKDLSLLGSTAFLSYSTDVYVSENNLFVIRNFRKESDKERGDLTQKSISMTEIAGVSYREDEFSFLGSVQLKGDVLDSYSLDEHQGILRAVTTTRTWITREDTSFAQTVFGASATETNASLYCVRLSDWKLLSAKENFAPPGESVRSVRFDKEKAYVCTSVQLTDPVFFFDLSDPERITVTDTGTIDGFSSSLVNLKDGYLLGIGVGENWDTVKIEVYRQGEERVESVCRHVYEMASYSTDYKSYLIDRERNLIGLGIRFYNNGPYNNGYGATQTTAYGLLFFDGKELRELLCEPLEGDPRLHRAVYQDGWIYLLGEDDFKTLWIG